jgi:transposase
MTPTVLGIDISKKDFYVSLLTETSATKPKKFTNNTQGFESLQNWLKQQNVVELHACMEATSIYGEALAEFLYVEGFQVSIVNPARIKGFAKSELLRTKTDSVDAALIARFCAAMKPSLWTPTAPEVKELQALLRRLESVTEMMTCEQNRLETATPTVAALTLEHLEYLKQQQQLIKKLIGDHFDRHPHLKQQRELLTSIPGIGDLNVRMRKALYMPAVVAMRHNPLLKAMSERLLGRGKVKMQVIGALMRKLVHLAFGILKSQKPFDPNYAIAPS